MAAQAAKDCLATAGIVAKEIGMLLVSSGSSERRFPGPAAGVAHRLGLDSVPAIDLAPGQRRLSLRNGAGR